MIDTNITFDNLATNDKKLQVFQGKYFEIIKCITDNGYTDELNRDIYAILNTMYQFINTIDTTSGLGQDKLRQAKDLSNSYYQAIMYLYTEKKIGFSPHAKLCCYLGQLVCRELLNSSWFKDAYGITDEQRLSLYYFDDKIGFLEKQKKQKALKPLGLTVEQFTNFVKLSRDYGYNIDRIITKGDNDKIFITLATQSLSVISNYYDRDGDFRKGLTFYIDALMDYTSSI